MSAMGRKQTFGVSSLALPLLAGSGPAGYGTTAPLADILSRLVIIRGMAAIDVVSHPRLGQGKLRLPYLDRFRTGGVRVHKGMESAELLPAGAAAT